MALAGQGDVRALPARGPRPGTLSRSVSRITVRTYTFPSAPPGRPLWRAIDSVLYLPEVCPPNPALW
jgi:hypothetical protein